MKLEQRILELMRDQNITQKDLSLKTGITEASISKYVNGKRQPRIDVILKFSKAFNVSTDYLLQGLEDEKLKSAFNETKLIIARNKDNMTDEEKNKLIKFILED